MILVTGGLGFIGSHTVVELIEEGYEVVVVDNLYNTKEEVKNRIKTITGKDIIFYPYDVCNKEQMREVFSNHKIDSIIHFAGYKAVGESVHKPIEYYENNLMSTLVLAEMMRDFDCNNIVFSSSATVYGDPKRVPIKEDDGLGETTNPYGTTKAFIEKILTDLNIAYPQMNVTLLRYFNPVGAHKSGLLGEDPNGIPNNLMPYVLKVADKELPILSIFGDDYDTPDGTGVRDYIHVVDLAKGHVAAIKNLEVRKGVNIYNLGTGVGYSVLDMVNNFMKITGVDVPYQIVERRPGDIATCYSDTEKSKRELGWVAEKTLEDMCNDAWNFILVNKK